MIQAVANPFLNEPLTLEQFLKWDDGTSNLYELIDGAPVPITDPNANHKDVADALCDIFKDHCQSKELPYVPKRLKLVSIDSSVDKGRTRRPDITVFDKVEWRRLKSSPSPAMAYTAPPLVIEVVSSNWRMDYLTKLAEYEATGIKEYWIIDFAAIGGMRYIGHPKQPTISIYWMDKEQNEYGEARQFQGNDRIDSLTLPELALTAEQVLKAGW